MSEQHDGTGPKPSTRFGGLSQQQEAVKQDYGTLGRKPIIDSPAPSRRSDAQTPKRSSERVDRERQTVYLPPELMRRVRHRIADTREEISEVVEKALELFLTQEGN
jgi:hypothetical protein